MATDKLDLRHKTFLDFNPSDEALDEILCGHDQSDKDFFLSNLNDEYRFSTYTSFTDFASPELAKAIREEYAEELLSLFNE